MNPLWASGDAQQIKIPLHCKVVLRAIMLALLSVLLKKSLGTDQNKAFIKTQNANQFL